MHNLKSSGFFSFPAEVSITPSNMWGGQGLLGNTVNLNEWMLFLYQSAWFDRHFYNDVIHGKALKSEFSQIVSIEPKLTTYWHNRVKDLKMSSVSMVLNVSHEERLFHSAFPQILSLLKGLIYRCITDISSWIYAEPYS